MPTAPPAELRTRLIQAAYEAAVAEGRFQPPQARHAPARSRLYRDNRLTLLAPHFDYAYYAFENPDFVATGLDELEHFDFFGWRRLRNPEPGFDVGYYLASNPDVLASGDNPFWHYILKGRAEGRAPRRPRMAERALLDALVPPTDRRDAPDDGAGLPRLGAGDLERRLGGALAGARGLVLSFADPGIDVSARPLWAAEGAAFRRAGFVHLQASPLRGAPMLRTMPPAWSETRLALEGETLGAATDAMLARAFEALADALPARRALVMRGVLGASVDGLLAVLAALKPEARLYWLNDFSSLCTSGRLLRNDVAFCGAPPPDSAACGICAHGEARRAHLDAMRRLFEAARFTVVAPSRGALELWRRASDLPHEAALLATPACLRGPEAPDPTEAVAELPGEAAPLNVAFLGPPTLARGWPVFERVLAACGDLAAYGFHHFARPEDLRPSRNLTITPSGPRYRDVLAANRVELAICANEGFEPFAWAALEALAAGCDVVALAHSGHAAELIGAERRGRVFADEDELLAFFTEGKAIAYARERARFSRRTRAIAVEAVSAALIG